MTQENHTPYTETNPDQLSPADALQRLYSYTESTGPDVGSLINDLKEEEANTSSFIEKIRNDGENYESPQEEEGKHFTDVVGMAREAADEDNATRTVEIITTTIIPTLEHSVSTFRDIEQRTAKLPILSEDTMNEIEQIRISYEHMLKLAEKAERQLQNES